MLISPFIEGIVKSGGVGWPESRGMQASDWHGTAPAGARRTRGDIAHMQFPLYFPARPDFFPPGAPRGCPTIFTAHDPVPHKWLLPGRLRWLEWNTLRWAYALSDRLIVHNETGRSALTEKFRQDPGKIVVISHGSFVRVPVAQPCAGREIFGCWSSVEPAQQWEYKSRSRLCSC